MKIKNMEILPTDDNIYESLINDSVGRNEDLLGFIEILSQISGNASIALNGNWGSGKTFFIKEAKMLLEVLNPYLKNTFEEKKKEELLKLNIKEEVKQCLASNSLYPIYFDAWSYDNLKDPIITLLYEMNKQLKLNFDFNDVDVTGILSSVADLILNRPVSKCIDKIKGEDLFSEQRSNEKLHSLVNDFINCFILNKSARMVIFVDELDRCRPTFAIEFFERIKHYFDNELITFVFSINKTELEHSIKKVYGYEFNSTRYLDRFFNWIFEMPRAKNDLFMQPFKSKNNHEFLNLMVKVSIQHFGITLRELPKLLFSIEKLLNCFDVSVHDDDSVKLGIFFIENFYLPYMLALKQVNTEKYDEFCIGRGVDEFLRIFKENTELADDARIYIESYNNRLNFQNNSCNILDVLKSVYETIFIESRENNKVKPIQCLYFPKNIYQQLMKNIQKIVL